MLDVALEPPRYKKEYTSQEIRGRAKRPSAQLPCGSLLESSYDEVDEIMNRLRDSVRNTEHIQARGKSWNKEFIMSHVRATHNWPFTPLYM